MMAIVAESLLVEGREKDTALVVGKEKDTSFPWKNDPWALDICVGVVRWTRSDLWSDAFSVVQLLFFVVNSLACILRLNSNSAGSRC